jgi:predicted metalloprotease with PDZ domain
MRSRGLEPPIGSMSYAVKSLLLLLGLSLLMTSSLTINAEAKQTAPTTVIDYEVRKVSVDRYEITLRFKGDGSGRARLQIPDEWASAQHAERGIEDLEILTPNATLEDTSDAHVKRITHRPGAMLEVRYRLKQIEDGEPNVQWRTDYLPVIQPSYFEWIGWTTWVLPTTDEQQVRVRMRFTGLPDDWSFASSFGLDRNAVAFEGSTEHFRESIFIGGDFRLRSRAVRGGQLVIAMRGEWPFRDSELADRVATIVDHERTFWKDNTQRDFLVTLMPIRTPARSHRSIGGTGLTRSFATWTTPIESLDDLDRLFTHEYFHTWNPAGLGTFAEPEALGNWFREGFTDYYTHLLLLRWNMLTLEQYASRYDDVLRSLSGLREGELPNAAIAARYFSEGQTIGKLPYWRGMLLAAKWDREIRTASDDKRSLDDAMRRLLAEHRRGIDILDAARIVRAVEAEGAKDAGSDVERYVDRGQRPLLADDVLTSCIQIGFIEDRPFDAGFNSEESRRTRTIVGVDPDGPGYAEGLRDGQMLRSISVTQQTDVPATVGVQDTKDGPVRVVEYMPVGKPIRRQHVTVRPHLSLQDRARCLAQLGAAPR